MTEQVPSDPGETPETDMAEHTIFDVMNATHTDTTRWVLADFARTQERKLMELAQLCRTMLGDDADDGKPTYRSIYAIEDKLKEWGIL